MQPRAAPRRARPSRTAAAAAPSPQCRRWAAAGGTSARTSSRTERRRQKEEEARPRGAMPGSDTALAVDRTYSDPERHRRRKTRVTRVGVRGRAREVLCRGAGL